MLDDLQVAWSPAMTWSELAAFCQRMTDKRRAIREARNIQPPLTRCPKCGSVSRSDIRGVSVRSALFALRKLGVVTESELKALDRSWKKHRAATGVDAYGRQPDPPAGGGDGSAPGCARALAWSTATDPSSERC
jgi:hypothetical protein